MEESRKGAAPGSSTKNSSASLDDDFGKDFLNSWKPSKFGKDSMDFDVEPINGKGKKFSFGKLDDFDLGADFDKLPSFKMDMSDLDFSSPIRKTGTKPSSESNSKDSSLGKKGLEKEKFSFTFDFDDLGKFDLDSEPSKEKKSSQIQIQPTNSITSSENTKTKTQNQNPNPESKSHDSIEQNMSKQPSEDMSNGSHNSRKINIFTSGENSEKREISLPSVSGDSSSRRFQEQEKNPSRRFNEVVVEKPNKQEESSRRFQDQEKNPSRRFNEVVEMPDNKQEDSSRRFQDQEKNPSRRFQEQDNPSRRFQEVVLDKSNKQEESSRRFQEQENPSRRFMETVDKSNKQEDYSRRLTEIVDKSDKRETNLLLTDKQESCSRRFQEVSDKSDKQEESSRRFQEVVEKSNKQENSTSVQSMGSSSHSRSASPVISSNKRNENEIIQKVDPNPSLREVRHVNSNLMKEKLSGSLLYKPQQNSILRTMQPSDCANKKNEGQNLNSSVIRREAQSDNSKIGLLSTVEKPLIKGAFIGSGNSKIDTEKKTFSTLRNTNKSILKDEKQTFVSRVVKLNQKSPNTATEKDLRMVKFSETNNNKVSLSPKNKTPTIQKPPIFSPSLKRKASEESVQDQFIHNPLKRISLNSPVVTRKSPEIVQKSPKMIAGNENPETLNGNLTSPKVLSLKEADFEIPVLLENNSNVQKADSISKDLDDICGLLKKKQEEAKELLVRAIVNNNKLLMLNHPMYDDKLGALESFAATLRSKHLIS